MSTQAKNTSTKPKQEELSKFHRIRTEAQKQRKDERRLRALNDEILSSSDEDEDIGAGLRLLKYMKKDSHETELIEAFNHALVSEPPEIDLLERIPTPPSPNSTMITWTVENDYAERVNAVEHKFHQGNKDRFNYALRYLKLRRKEESLDFCHMYIDDEKATEIAGLLQVNTMFRSLNISMNSIGPVGVEALAEALAQHEPLEELCLDYNQLGFDGSKKLAKCLQRNSRLTSLSLQGNMIGPNLPEEFLMLTSLEKLSLAANALETVPIEILKLVPRIDVENNSPKLPEFLENILASEKVHAERRANRNAAHCAIDDSWAAWNDLRVKDARSLYVRALQLARLASSEEELSTLLNTLEAAIIMREEALGRDFVPQVVDPTQVMITESIERAIEQVRAGTKQLSLYSQKIGDIGATSLGREILANSTLTWLDLYGCDIGPEGGGHFFRFLENNVTCSTVWLDNNQLRDSGATLLAEALGKNTSLEKLSLDYNGIGPEGCTHIAHALRANPSFRELSLARNPIGDAGAAAIAEALGPLRNLQGVDISGGGSGRAGALALSQRFEMHDGVTRGILLR